MKWADGTPKSTNNAFTRHGSIDWASLNPQAGSIKGGAVTAKKNGTPVYLQNSSQVRAYSAAGAPK